MRTQALRRRMPDHVADAITAIIEFFWMDESRDYLSRPRDEQKGHIFNEMLTVQQWLQNGKVKSRGGQHGQ